MGLCFKCNEKFSPGHKCKKSVWIESIMEVEISGSSEEDDGQELDSDEGDGVPPISLNALTGTSTLNNMRVMGRIHGQTGDGLD